MKNTFLACAVATAIITATSEATIVGTTNDFISAAWKAYYGARWTSSTNELVSPTEDFDLDGCGILDEFRSGTSPMSARASSSGADAWIDERPTPCIRVTIGYAGKKSLSALHFDLISEASGRVVARYDVRDGEARSMVVAIDAPGRRQYVRELGPVTPGTFRITPLIEGASAIVDKPLSRLSGSLSAASGAQIGRIDYQTGSLVLDMARLRSMSRANEVKLGWTERFDGFSPDGFATVCLNVPYDGHALPGRHYLACYADDDGNKTWKAGSPYGLSSIDVGWSGALAEVQISDTNPSIMRMNIRESMQNNTFEAQRELNDRGMYDSINIYTLRELKVYPPARDKPGAKEESCRVRFVRSAINNIASYQSGNTTMYASGSAMDTLLFDKDITEYELIRSGELDLDWNNIVSLGNTLAISSVTTMMYRVVFGHGNISPVNEDLTNQNNLATMFINRYENRAVGSQTSCIPICPCDVVHSTNPTFRWSHGNSIMKDYPAMRLRVYKGNNLTYDTGNIRAPLKGADGVYSFKPRDLQYGCVTKLGRVFGNGSYTFTVSMLDSKFTTPNSSERSCAFRISVGDDDDLGRMLIKVRYAGTCNAVAFSNGLTNGIVRIEASKWPDFSSIDRSSYLSRVTNLNIDMNSGNHDASIVAMEDSYYYVRAYIDTNGDGVLSPGEPYGFTADEDFIPQPVYVAPGTNTPVNIRMYDTVL